MNVAMKLISLHREVHIYMEKTCLFFGATFSQPFTCSERSKLEDHSETHILDKKMPETITA